jgi:hypothetical protein
LIRFWYVFAHFIRFKKKIPFRLKDDDSEVLKILRNNETGMTKYESSIVDTLEDVVERSYLFHTGPLCCVTLLMLILWYRKRQYDRRGIHKKIEVDIP